MKTTTNFLLFFFIFQTSASADWKYSGSAGPYLNSLGIPSTTKAPSDKAGITTDFSFEKKFESNYRFKSDIFIRTDFVARDAEEFFQIIPKNLYLQKSMSSINIRFGFQTLAIDGPDVVNPADIIHAKNWIDPTSPVTMSSAGLSFSQEVDDWNWELFYVPKQTAALLPGSHSPWLPRKNRLPIESVDTEIQIPDNVSYQYLDPIELDNALDHNVTLKLQHKSDNLETQFVYYNGLSQSPFLLTKVNGTLISVNPEVIFVDSPVRLQPLYYRHHALAGTFLVPFESWAIRGGLNWLKPQGSDDRIPKETYMAVIGLEKSVETSFGLVTGIVDYVKQEQQNANQISFLRSVLEEAVTFGARIPFGEETQFFTGGIYDLIGKSSLIKLSATHRLSNAWSMEAQTQFLQGPDETLIGLYKKYDSIQLKFLFSW